MTEQLIRTINVKKIKALGSTRQQVLVILEIFEGLGLTYEEGIEVSPTLEPYIEIQPCTAE